MASGKTRCVSTLRYFYLTRILWLWNPCCFHSIHLVSSVCEVLLLPQQPIFSSCSLEKWRRFVFCSCRGVSTLTTFCVHFAKHSFRVLLRPLTSAHRGKAARPTLHLLIMRRANAAWLRWLGIICDWDWVLRCLSCFQASFFHFLPWKYSRKVVQYFF